MDFSYIEGHEVLHDINLDIMPGQTVALVGQSGSGKSTLVDLLPRFYDPQGGSITVGGTDLRDLAVHDLRSLMGNVNQEAILFNDTIRANIAFGVESATDEQIEQAARVANAHDFIMATEQGYDTNIGDRGCRLSGGQRQRISIARAILKNPSVLILDEATSALDTESERLVQEALERLMQGAHHRSDSPPTQHHSRRRPHLRHARGAHSGARHPRGAYGQRRPIQAPG